MNPLQSHLAAVRRRLWLVTGFRGLAWLLALLLGTAVFAGWLDWNVPGHLPSLVRAVILVGVLSGAGYIAYRYLIRPLATSADDLSLALKIEKIYPQLNDSLASTVQFLEQMARHTPSPRPSPPGGEGEMLGSPALRKRAVERTLQGIEEYDLKKVVDTRGAPTAGLTVLAAASLALALLFMNPALAWTALKRLADPFGGTRWPLQTQLELEPTPTRLARGEPFEIHGRVAGVVPDQVFVDFAGNVSFSHTANVIKNKDGGMFTARLDRVERDFRFQVRANDAVSEWRAVTVQPPPVLVPLDGRASPQVHLCYPAYTELPEQDLPDGNGNIEAILGTSVTFRAKADRPIARAWIEYRPEQNLVKEAAQLGPLGSTGCLQALASILAGKELTDQIPINEEQGGQVLAVQFLPRVTGMYALHIEDESGLASTRLFDLRILPDPAPSVDLQRPARSHDSLELLPHAEISLEATAEDRLFALRSVFVEYRCKKEDPLRRMFLYDYQPLEQSLLRAVSPLAFDSQSGPLGVASSWLPGAGNLHLRPPHLRLSQRLALDRITHLDGRPLKEGDIVTLQACADDFDDVSVFKAPGRSHEVELRIVSPATLERALSRAQAQVQQELLNLQKLQQDASKHVIAAEQEWRNKGKLEAKDVDQLLQGEQLQQQIRNRTGAKEEGLRADVERILQALRDNQVPRSGTHDRMETVAAELDRLARENLEQAEANLTVARKENESPVNNDPKLPSPRPSPPRGEGERKGPLGEARQHQEEIETTLKDLLKLLEPWSKIKDVKGEANNLLKEQRRHNQDTRDMDQENTRGQERDNLKPEQKAALDKAAELQNRLADRAKDLLDKMDRLAKERQTKDPDVARALQGAAQQGKKDNVTGQMKEAGQNLKNNQLGKADGQQRQSTQTLEKMVQELEEQREQELERMSKKLKENEQKLDDLAKEQDELSKKTKEAAKIADPAERKKELQQLAREQEQLQKKTEETLRELTRQRQELSDAGGSMEEAAGKMAQGQDPEEAQQDALDRLNEARRKVQREQEEVEDELAREKLAKVADQIKRLKERQEAALAETDRLQQQALRKKAWSRPLRSSLRDLVGVEKGLAGETDSLAKDKLAGAKVFARLLAKAAEAMNQAAEHVQKQFDKVNAAPEDTAEAKEIKEKQKEAAHRLDQLLDALKPDKGQARRPARAEDNGGAGGGGRSAGGGGDNIPPMAQLKALRALQQEINERTEKFSQKHPDSLKLSEVQKRELQTLRKDQREIAALLDEITAPTAEGEGDKK